MINLLPYSYRRQQMARKRAIVKSVLSRARNRFQVSAAEIDDLDAHRRATLGFALVSNDARHARSVLDKLIGFVAGATSAELIERGIRIEHIDIGASGPLGLAEERWDPGGLDDDDFEDDFEDDDGDEEG